MSRAGRALGVVSLAVLDLRRAPDHRAELGSQLLVGEVARRLSRSRDGLWWRVENLADGYRGWVRAWGVVPASAARAASWRRRARARVRALFAEVRTGRGAGALVSPLSLGGRVIAGRRRGGFRPVELPDGRRGWVKGGALEVGRTRPPSLIERVRSLLGIPYLWGGRTPLGLDCSGFTQLVLAEQGVGLPRDARRQFRAARPLRKGEPPRPGDLVFFGRRGAPVGHVGMGLGAGYYAHARGTVRISSVDKGNPLCDNELAGQVRGWRRPVMEAP